MMGLSLLSLSRPNRHMKCIVCPSVRKVLLAKFFRSLARTHTHLFPAPFRFFTEKQIHKVSQSHLSLLLPGPESVSSRSRMDGAKAFFPFTTVTNVIAVRDSGVVKGNPFPLTGAVNQSTFYIPSPSPSPSSSHPGTRACCRSGAQCVIP